MSILKDFISKLTEISVDQEKEEYNNPLIPFNLYKEKMICQASENYDECKKTLEHGYQVILEAIENKKI